MIPSPDVILAAIRHITGMEPTGSGGNMSRTHPRRVATYCLVTMCGMTLGDAAKVLLVNRGTAKYAYRMAKHDAGTLATASHVRRLIDKEVA